MIDNDMEKREFTRVPIKIEGEVMTENSTVISGWVSNVNMKGLFLNCDDYLPVGSDCRVALFLGDPKDHPCIKARSNIVRIDDNGMAIEFTEILGTDSFNHLRNLVLHNSSTESERVEQELRDHLGLKRRG